jgi:hypothetical protein
MATDKRILASEYMVGATHATLADTLNRLALMDHTNSGAHRYISYELTNSAAGSTAVGDVLAVSSQTAILGDTVSSLQQYVVAAEVIANAATGRFVGSGIVSAKCNGACAAMQYVRKSATARSIEDAGVTVGATVNPPIGAVGVALAAASGGLALIFLYGRTVSGSGIVGITAATIVLKTANEVVNNSSTLQNDNELLIAVAANDKLLVKIHLEYDSDAAADFKVAFTGPAASAFQWAYPNNIFVNSLLTVTRGSALTLADESTSGATGIGAGTHNFIDVIGTFVNGANAGTFQLQWAQSAATGSDTTLYGPGSWLEAMKV